MKHTWLRKTMILPALLAMHSMAQANVLITEYVEGSSNNKAVEISNLGSSTVDLSDYKLFRVANGNSDSTDSQSFTGISLDAGASYVLYNNSATAAFKEAPNSASSNLMSHNGDDSFELRTGASGSSTTGTLVDSIGQAGNDDNYSVNETLRRNADITTGDTDQNDAWSSAAEWTSFASDTADGLGCPGITDCASYVPPGPVTPSDGALLISEIVNGTGSNKVIEISNTSGETIDLAADGYKLQIFIDEANDLDPDWPDEQVFLQGSLPDGASLVVYDSSAGANFQKASPTGLVGGNAMVFTGNDAIILVKGTDEQVIDSFGQVGAVDTIVSATATLRRKETVVSGNTTSTDIFNAAQSDEWAIELQDTFDGLGCPGESTCTGAEPSASTGTVLDLGLCFNCPDITPVFDINNYDFNTYYSTTLTADATNKTAFRTALNQDISANYNQLSYSEVWSALTYTDEDPTDADNVILLYTGRSIFKQQNGSGDQSNNQDYWNREHVWAKSRGFPSSSQLGYTDIHHLRPADISINSARSNFDFANGGEPVDGTTNKLVSGLSWEPRDEVKGDVARMMFYMAIRYELGEVDMPDLILVDKAGDNDFDDGDSTAQFGKLCDLYAWHEADPVSDFERNRNNRIHEYQGNRNPFIDNPDWVAVAFKNTCVFEVTPINFTDQVGVELSTTITSAKQTVTGFTNTQNISVIGGEYSLGCNDTFTSVAGTIEADTDVCVRHQSSSEYATVASSAAATSTTVLTIGEFDFSFSSITKQDPISPENPAPIDQTPNNLAFFVQQLNVELNEMIVSSRVLVQGLADQATTDIVIAGGEYSIGCNDTFTAEAGTVENNDLICVRHTSASTFESVTTTAVTIGGVRRTFISATKADGFVEVKPTVEQDIDDADAVGTMNYWFALLLGALGITRRRSQR